jgi:hypothetical protein
MKVYFLNMLIGITSSSIVFWDVKPCPMAETDQHFRGIYCFHHQGRRIKPNKQATGACKWWYGYRPIGARIRMKERGPKEGATEIGVPVPGRREV